MCYANHATDIRQAIFSKKLFIIPAMEPFAPCSAIVGTTDIIHILKLSLSAVLRFSHKPIVPLRLSQKHNQESESLCNWILSLIPPPVS